MAIFLRPPTCHRASTLYVQIGTGRKVKGSFSLNGARKPAVRFCLKSMEQGKKSCNLHFSRFLSSFSPEELQQGTDERRALLQRHLLRRCILFPFQTRQGRRPLHIRMYIHTCTPYLRLFAHLRVGGRREGLPAEQKKRVPTGGGDGAALGGELFARLREAKWSGGGGDYKTRERGKKTRGSITMAYGGGLHGRTVPA